jgi:sec-independent protein translocase protein TatC
MAEDYSTGKDTAAEENEMSFLDHLEELRWRIIKAIIGIVVGAVICGIFIDWIMNYFLLAPAMSTNPPLVLINLKPYGQLVLYMEVVLVGGIIISIPNIFYQFWKFIEPGLLVSERRYISWIVFFSTFCFWEWHLHILMLPTALKFFAAFGTQAISNNIAVNSISAL